MVPECRSFIPVTTGSCCPRAGRSPCLIIAASKQSRRERASGKRSTIEHFTEVRKFTPNGRRMIDSKCSTAARSSKSIDFSRAKSVTRFGVTWKILAKELCANVAKKSGLEFDHFKFKIFTIFIFGIYNEL